MLNHSTESPLPDEPPSCATDMSYKENVFQRTEAKGSSIVREGKRKARTTSCTPPF